MSATTPGNMPTFRFVFNWMARQDLGVLLTAHVALVWPLSAIASHVRGNGGGELVLAGHPDNGRRLERLSSQPGTTWGRQTDTSAQETPPHTAEEARYSRAMSDGQPRRNRHTGARISGCWCTRRTSHRPQHGTRVLKQYVRIAQCVKIAPTSLVSWQNRRSRW
jgi:hypothetical protein